MKQLHRVYIFLLLLIPVISQSCIRDDLSDCISDKRIYFDYEPALLSQRNGGINPDDITRMDLFVFDENGLFIKEYIDEAPQMGPEYFITVTGLKTGYYKFVAWGNLKEHYTLSSDLVPGETSFNDLRVFLECIKNNEVEEQLSPLFFATHTGTNSVEILGMSPQFIRVNLVNDMYKINVTVSGIDSASVADNDYKLTISDDNGIYNFDNDFAPCREFTYTQTCLVDKERNNELTASLIVLRLTADRKPLLRLVNKQTNNVLIEENLVNLILEVNEAGAAIDFDKTHEFDIRYELDQTSSIGIIIYVNGWKLIRQPGILD
jgi:hypothetical protein